MSIKSIDIWKASQFHMQLGGFRDDLKLKNTYFSHLKSFINVYNSDHFHTLPMSSILFHDVKIAYLCYYRQFGDYISSHTGGLCEHIYLLNGYFSKDDLDLKFTHPTLSCMSKRQKYIYSILVNSVQNYVGSYF